MGNYKVKLSEVNKKRDCIPDVNIQANIDTGTSVKIDINKNQSIVIIVYPDYMGEDVSIYNVTK